MWEFVCVVSIMQICLKLCLVSLPQAIIFVDWITDLLISEEEDIWWIFLQKFFLWLQFFFASKFMADKRKCFIIYLNKKLFKSNSIKFYYLKMTFFIKKNNIFTTCIWWPQSNWKSFSHCHVQMKNRFCLAFSFSC